MLLFVKVSLHHDVDVVVTTPKPIEGVLAESSDVGNMESHGILCESCFLWRCAVEWWIVIWGFRSWQRSLDLSWCDKGCRLYGPDLHNLARQLGCQKGEHRGVASIVSNPHQISVHQNGKVVTTVMCWSSVTDVGYWHVFGAGPGETIKGSWHCEGSMSV